MSIRCWMMGLLLALPLGATALEFDDEVAEAPVTVEDARIRWLPGESPMAGYMTLQNTGSEPLQLTGATSQAFDLVTMHRSGHAGGRAQMASVQRVELPPGQAVAFEPGGYHLMLEQRQQPIEAGNRVEVTLKFNDGSVRRVEFEVRSPTLQ